MKFLISILLLTTMMACNSKKPLADQKEAIFILLMKEGTSPKSLNKELSIPIRDMDPINKTKNEWRVNFGYLDQDQRKALVPQLLNHPLVITISENEKPVNTSTTNTKKGKVTPSEKQ